VGIHPPQRTERYFSVHDIAALMFIQSRSFLTIHLPMTDFNSPVLSL